MNQSYQLYVVVPEALVIAVGGLGLCDFPAGCYVYTGSARKNLAARIARHLAMEKRTRWHIDYLLAAPGVYVESVVTYREPECVLNRITAGTILITRFGATDCRAGCGSHLKFRGWSGAPTERAPMPAPRMHPHPS